MSGRVGRREAEKTDIAFRLDEMSRLVDALPNADISQTLLDAADTMSTLRIFLSMSE